jgi:hypothetical protein
VVTIAVFMVASSCWAVALAVAREWASGRYIHAERLLAKVGGSNCKPRGIPTLATRAQRKWKGRSAAEVCTSAARKIGEWLAGARGEAPLSGLCCCLFFSEGRCGEGGPPRRGGGGGCEAAADGRRLPP